MHGDRVIPKYILLVVLFLGVISVFYFSWVPDPNIGSMKIFPTGLGNVINNYGNLRTSIPFFLLGAILEFKLSSIRNLRKRRWIIIFGLALLVTIAEVGQLFLPMRHFDLMDIFWGILGSVGGMLMAWVCKWLLSQ